MRLEHHLRPVNSAPGAGKSVAVLEKINGAFEFGRPAAADHFAPGFVDEHQRSRLNHRMHEPVVHSDEGVAMVFQIEAIEERERQLPPTLNQAAEKSRAPNVDSG